MKYLLIVVVLLAGYILYSYGYIKYRMRISKNPAIIQQAREVGSGSALRYIAAGDSTAVGEGASSLEHTYSYLITNELAQDHRVVYENVAVSGAQTSDVINEQIDKIVAFNPDIVTISIGANDNTHLISNKVVLQNFKTIIGTLTEKTHATIYMTDIPNFNGAFILPRPYIALLEARSKSLNKEIAALENDRVKIVNIHDFGWDTFPDRQVTYSSDSFHPSDRGYENWKNAFVNKIK